MPGKEVVVGEGEWQSLKLLTAVEDDFGGLNVEMADQPMDAAVFAIKLRASISCWRLQVGLPYVGGTWEPESVFHCNFFIYIYI